MRWLRIRPPRTPYWRSYFDIGMPSQHPPPCPRRLTADGVGVYAPSSLIPAPQPRKELDERCRHAGFRPEWGDVLRDLDRLQEVEICKDGQQITLRTPSTGVIGPLFQAAASPCHRTCARPPKPDLLNPPEQRPMWCYGLHTSV